LDRRLGGPQGRSGRGGEEKNLQSLPRFEPPVIQPVAQRYTTSLTTQKYLESEIHACSRVILEKLIVTQLVKKFPDFYGTRRFITVFIEASHWILYCAR
jgi:hypothetical protein